MHKSVKELASRVHKELFEIRKEIAKKKKKKSQ